MTSQSLNRVPRSPRARLLARAVSGVGLATCALLAACGSRSGLNVDQPMADAAGESCSTAPLCSDNTRGTWRLETASHQPAGYLFTFDGSAACNESSDAFLLVLAPSAGECNRAGEYSIQENTSSVFRISASNLGGSFSAACGGDPAAETLHLELSRAACESVRYELAVEDSKPGSPYDMTAVATRCRCDIGWEPCTQPLPVDPCAP